MDAIYRSETKWGTDTLLKFYGYYIDVKLSHICKGDKRITSMTQSCQLPDLDTIYRLDGNWGPEFLSQVLYGVLATNFVKNVRVTKELHPWHHHGGHMT